MMQNVQWGRLTFAWLDVKIIMLISDILFEILIDATCKNNFLRRKKCLDNRMLILFVAFDLD